MNGACSTHERDSKCKMLANLKGHHIMGYLGTYGKIVLKWIIRKYNVSMWTEFI
jgi:hypothetical protein